MYRDIIEDSWVYQEILKEGLEKGENQGLARGEQRALLAIIQKRFPDVVPSVRQRISGVTDTNLLESLIADVSVAQISQEALEILSVLKGNGHRNGREEETSES